MKLSDEQLMLQVKNGSRESFQGLVERHKLTVLNMCLRFTRNKEDAEDLAQDVFLRIFEAAPRYQESALFTTYLYRVTLNVCLNHQRRKKILRFFSLDSKPNNGSPQDAPAYKITDNHKPDIEIEKFETQQFVQKAIDSLPENQKIAVILFRYLNLSYQEIAEILDTSVSAVESRLHRAKLNLKKKLAPLLGEFHIS
ncbi:MAG: sigma-70 family RNA polymerase sigma factor [Calditrichaeota bacterium]|nr:sigma-70 family RNA polymerase sigma factor [Calditrichota bacterium]